MTLRSAAPPHNAGFDLKQWMQVQLHDVERALEEWVVSKPDVATGCRAPQDLINAMRYAVLDGGKRLRPLLVLAGYDAAQNQAGGQDAFVQSRVAALRAACAVELIHAYSLVHDDMPCMDNDVLRRGKATVHVKFGEAGALLAGDALQALAFELLTPDDGSVAPLTQAGLCGLLARAAGSSGMAGGQAIDLASVGRVLDEQHLREMHQQKTGALLRCSVLMGAHCASASASALHALEIYGGAIGLAFQVVDDILDVTSDSATLGKTAGKDADNDKPTYVSLMGLQGSQQYAKRLLDQALSALDQSGLNNTAALAALADMVVNRTH